MKDCKDQGTHASATDRQEKPLYEGQIAAQALDWLRLERLEK